MKRPARRVSAIAAGIHFSLCTLIPLWAGVHIDRRYAFTPWGTLLGLAAGFAWGILAVIRPLWMEASDRDRSDDDNAAPHPPSAA